MHFLVCMQKIILTRALFELDSLQQHFDLQNPAGILTFHDVAVSFFQTYNSTER